MMTWGRILLQSAGPSQHPVSTNRTMCVSLVSQKPESYSLHFSIPYDSPGQPAFIEDPLWPGIGVAMVPDLLGLTVR